MDLLFPFWHKGGLESFCWAVITGHSSFTTCFTYMSALHSFEYQNMILSSESSWEGFNYLKPNLLHILILIILSNHTHTHTHTHTHISQHIFSLYSIFGTHPQLSLCLVYISQKNQEISHGIFSPNPTRPSPSKYKPDKHISKI